jgi:hypothetical protein
VNFRTRSVAPELGFDIASRIHAARIEVTEMW